MLVKGSQVLELSCEAPLPLVFNPNLDGGNRVALGKGLQVDMTEVGSDLQLQHNFLGEAPMVF